MQLPSIGKGMTYIYGCLFWTTDNIDRVGEYHFYSESIISVLLFKGF